MGSSCCEQGKKRKEKKKKKEKEGSRQEHACCNNNNHTSSINIQRFTASINADAPSASFLPIAPFRPYIPIPIPPSPPPHHTTLPPPDTGHIIQAGQQQRNPHTLAVVGIGLPLLTLLYSSSPFLTSQEIVKRPQNEINFAYEEMGSVEVIWFHHRYGRDI